VPAFVFSKLLFYNISMTKNPLINSLAALTYISLVGLVMYFGSDQRIGVSPIVGPVAIISLFTLSAAVMGYVFLYQPLVLYFDNRKKEALNLFLQTVAIFGVTTLILLGLLFLRIV